MIERATLEAGDAAPEFEVLDSTGATRRMRELAAAGPVIFLFYRGHW